MPLAARDRGDGRSVLSVGGPGGAPALAFVFDNASGRITAVCADATRPERDCTATDALLLAGWVRFSLGVPPDPLRPTDPPLSLDVALEATHGTLVAPGCRTEARHDGLAYHCAVAPAAGAWSGRSVLVPHGWTIGTAPGQYRVCRYTSASGTTHPSIYDHVDRNLMQENFLVIRGDQACRSVTATPEWPDGVVTASHQP